VLAKFVSVGVTRSIVAMSSRHADGPGATPQILTILTRVARSSPAALRSVVDSGGTQLAVMHLQDADQRTVSVLLFTVTFHANLAHSLTRSP
jgi:hypothetical protein